MVLATNELNHELDSFHEALGVSENSRTKCRERVFFSTIANALQRNELFEDEDDAPKELRTVTGDLQRCLRLIKDPLEYEYTLLIFSSAQRTASQSVGMYQALKEKRVDKEDFLKIKLFDLLEKLHNKEDKEDEDDLIDQIDRKSMIKRCEFVSNSHYNFDTYMNMLNRWCKSTDLDIDDLLKNILNDED